MKDAESWKQVAGYEYEVSSYGRIRRVSGQVLKPDASRDYIKFQLYKDGIGTLHALHILVCTAFNGPRPFPEAKCLHRDDNRTNNTPKNLYWGTHQENMQDAIANGKINPGVNSKLNWDKVRELRGRAARGESGQKLSQEVGLTPAAMNKILSNRSWKDPDYVRAYIRTNQYY